MAEDPDLIAPDPDWAIREAGLIGVLEAMVAITPRAALVAMKRGFLAAELKVEEGPWPFPGLPQDDDTARRVHREYLRLIETALASKPAGPSGD